MNGSTKEQILDLNYPYQFIDITRFIDHTIAGKPYLLIAPVDDHSNSMTDEEAYPLIIYQLGNARDGAFVNDGKLNIDQLENQFNIVSDYLNDELKNNKIKLLIMPLRLKDGYTMWYGVHLNQKNPQIIIFGGNYEGSKSYNDVAVPLLKKFFKNSSNAPVKPIVIQVPKSPFTINQSGPLILESIRFITEQITERNNMQVGEAVLTFDWHQAFEEKIKKKSLDITALRKRDSQRLNPVKPQNSQKEEIKRPIIIKEPGYHPCLDFIINTAGIPVTGGVGLGILMFLGGVGTLCASAAVPNPVLPIVGACLCIAGAALIIGTFILKFGACLFEYCFGNEDKEEYMHLIKPT